MKKSQYCRTRKTLGLWLGAALVFAAVLTLAASSAWATTWNVPNNFWTIGHAVASDSVVSGDIIEVNSGNWSEGIVSISKNLTIRAADSNNPPTIVPTTSTGASGDARGWFLVNTGCTVNFEYLNSNGSEYSIHQAIRHKGAGTISHCNFSNIRYALYIGLAIVSFDNNPFVVEDCQFTNIERIGTIFFGANTSTKVFRRNTYTGEGAVDGLRYACELGGGAVATVENSTITNCTGIGSVDGSTSAGVLATDYYGPGTEGTFTGNVVTNCTDGLAIGYDASDAIIATIYSNKMETNTYDVGSVSTVTVNASGNWW